jgi:hypothetical protein
LNAYRIAGLSVESDVAFPGAGSVSAAGAPDILIGAGHVPDHLPNAFARGPSWAMTRDSLLLDLPGIARLLVSGGRDIRYRAAPGADEADVTAFLLGPVLGVLLHQRGAVVLRASVVRVRDRAVLFCGGSGAGKSTLAAALTDPGYALVADDICVVDFNGRAGPRVHGDGQHLKLWQQAVDALGLTGRRGAPIRKCLQKFHVAPHATHAEALPIGAIYSLYRDRPPRRTGIVRPNAVDATLLLAGNAYHPLLVRLMDQRAKYFHAAAAIADKADIYELTRPFSFAAMADVVCMLERHWAERAFTEAAA